MPDRPAPDAPRTLREVSRVRVHHLRQAKGRGERITMLTAYDSAVAAVFDGVGIDILLVGDSMGTDVLGHPSTIPVTVDEMLPAVRAVSSAARRALVIADLPFGSYEASPEQCFATAVRMVKDGGAHGVKVEGGAHLADHVRLLTRSGIPVVGHIGLTPQTENLRGGPVAGGVEDDEAVVDDAVALAEAGAVAVVLAVVPAAVAERITEVVDIPTIGIGAGAACDGQVLVWTDMAGMTENPPPFTRQFGQVGAALRAAAQGYAAAVRGGEFPGPSHTLGL